MGLLTLKKKLLLLKITLKCSLQQSQSQQVTVWDEHNEVGFSTPKW